MSDPLEIRRKRLQFRCDRRGFKELDLLFQAFAKAHLQRLDSAALDRLEALLDVPDKDLYGWVVGQEDVPATYDTDIYKLLIAYRPTWNA